MALSIYVMSNVGMFADGINAMVALCQSKTFQTAIGLTTGLAGTYVGVRTAITHDFMGLLKFVILLLLLNSMAFIPTTVVIKSITDQTDMPRAVDNVPIGMSLPAHIATIFGYALTQQFNTAFHTLKSYDDAFDYNKTGLLFGSHLFNLSTRATLEDPEIMGLLNDYVKNCVVGDILLNHGQKYTANDLIHSEDVWSLITANPSPVRGLFYENHFYTCREAVGIMNAKMNQYIQTTGFDRLAQKAQLQRSAGTYSKAAIQNLLTQSYQYFQNASQSAVNILRQNIAINSIRSGIKSYAASTDATAEIQNIANTTAEQNILSSFMVSGSVGITTIPVWHVLLTLIFFCSFPLLVLMLIIPSYAQQAARGYVEFIVWLQTMPILYAILNLGMNYYAQDTIHGAMTLSNVNELAHEHAMIAGMAGYLVMAIPVISGAIIRKFNFPEAFVSASQYLGGMMHSAAQGAATSVSMGNNSMGNISMDNATANTLSANKHDTNFTSLSGMSTSQLSNGALVSHAANGSTIYNTSPAMSQLATHLNVAQTLASSYSQQADSALTSSLQNQARSDSLISSAFTQSNQLSNSLGHNSSLNAGSQISDTASIEHGATTAMNVLEQYAKSHGISVQKAYEGFASGEVSLSAGVLTGKGTLSAGAKSTYRNSGDDNNSLNKQYNLNNEVRSGLNQVKRYSEDHAISDSNTQAENKLIQIGNDLRQADSISNAASVDRSRSERLAHAAQYVSSHSEAIQSNFGQALAQYITDNYANSNELLSNVSDTKLMEKTNKIANEFLKGYSDSMLDQFSSKTSNINPDEMFATNSQTIGRQRMMLTENYQHRANAMSTKFSEKNTREISDIASSVSAKFKSSSGAIANTTQEQVRLRGNAQKDYSNTTGTDRKKNNLTENS